MICSRTGDQHAFADSVAIENCTYKHLARDSIGEVQSNSPRCGRLTNSSKGDRRPSATQCDARYGKNYRNRGWLGYRDLADERVVVITEWAAATEHGARGE